MAARVIETPSTLRTGKADVAILCETMTELAEHMKARGVSISGGSWIGGLTAAMADRCLREGEASRVAASEDYLAKFEGKFAFHTARFKTIDAVAGGAPNVAAYIAGTPLAMRRRQRTADDLAPLTIVVDTTSSGGINAAKLERRGAALLALVRLLAARRPVTLWAGAALGPRGDNRVQMCSVMTRIETAPLDLARAAFLLGHPGASRGIGYSVIGEQCRGFGAWPYNDIDKTRTYGPEYFGRLFPGTEILYMPPVFGGELESTAPDKWLTEKLAKYGGLENEA